MNVPAQVKFVTKQVEGSDEVGPLRQLPYRPAAERSVGVRKIRLRQHTG